MTPNARRARPGFRHFLLPALAGFSLLAGCSGRGASTGVGSDKAVAAVNGEEITEARFLDRVQNVTAWNLAPALEQHAAGRIPGKAGEYAMQSIIAEVLILQLAKEKSVVPTDEQVAKYAEMARKYQSPQATLVPQDNYRNEADWKRDTRTTLAFRNMVMAGVKLNEADLKKDFEQFKTQLAEPTSYHLRLVDTVAEAKIKEAQKALSSDVAFETVALKYSEDPASAANNGDVGFVPEPYLKANVPALLTAVQSLKPGEHTRAYVKASVPTGGQAAGQAQPKLQTHYYLAQLVEKKVGKSPSYEDVKALLENRRMGQNNPGAFQQVQRDLVEFQNKAKIEVFLKPYTDMPQKIRALGGPRPGGAPGTQPPAGGPPGPAGAAPAMPPTGAPPAPR